MMVLKKRKKKLNVMNNFERFGETYFCNTVDGDGYFPFGDGY